MPLSYNYGKTTICSACQLNNSFVIRTNKTEIVNQSLVGRVGVGCGRSFLTEIPVNVWSILPLSRPTHSDFLTT